MSRTQANHFVPDYLVRPGEVLEDYLDDIGMTQAELADRTGLAKKTINEIVKGKAPITTETALKLERTLGRPTHFWCNLERQYQEDLLRIKERQLIDSNLKWWERHHGPIPDKHQVHHINGDKLDNRIENLELVSALEHKRKHGGCYKDGAGNWIKPCRRCGVAQPVESHYYKRRDGISPWCKSCCKANASVNQRKRRASAKAGD